MQKAKYYYEYRKMYTRLSNLFRPRIERALRKEVEAFAEAYRTSPFINTASVSAPNIERAVMQLHITAGINNANRIRRAIEVSIKSAYTDRNDIYAYVITEYIKQNGLANLVTQISDTLKEAILATIEKGQAEGWGVDRIVRELNQATFPKWMAQRIVRTELGIASNTGAMVAATEIGVDVKKEWISATDNRTRRMPRDQTDHLHMDGKTVEFDAKFLVDGKKSDELMSFPGDPSASANNLCNCRCTVAFIPQRDDNGNLKKLNTNNNPFVPLLENAKNNMAVTSFIVNQITA
jgi:hypothetical protein